MTVTEGGPDFFGPDEKPRVFEPEPAPAGQKPAQQRLARFRTIVLSIHGN